MTEITKEVLTAKRSEYLEKLQMYQNTVIAIQGALEALDDLLSLCDAEAIPDVSNIPERL